MANIPDLQAQISQKRQEIGQRFADVPQTEARIRESLFGGDEVLRSLRQQETDKVKELFTHDQAVAQQYQTPPEEGMILDPYIRELQLSQRYGGTMGELADIRQNLGARRDVLGDALERGMKMLLAGIEAGKWESESLERELDRETAKEERERERRERVLRRSTTIIEAGGRKLLIDDQTGEVIKDLGATETSPDLSQYLDILRGLSSRAKPKTKTTKPKPVQKGGTRPPLSAFDK